MATNAAWPALLASFAVASACKGSDSEGDHEPGSAVGRRLDAFSFPDLAGREFAWSPEAGLRVDSEELRRLQALVIHVFQPDCPACREQARELERLSVRAPERFGVLGIAHRLDTRDVQGFSEDTRVTYPLLLGTGSAWADHWGRGDSMYVVDRRGMVSYAQVGFHPSDIERWQAVLDDLAAGRIARFSGPERDGLVVGEAFPVIELPLVDGEGTARFGLNEEGQLMVERAGERRLFRAAVGFFSRY